MAVKDSGPSAQFKAINIPFPDHPLVWATSKLQAF